MVLVGPSGCGKSTALRMIAGLEEITGGTISIGDRVVNDVPPKDRDIAMVFQSYALYPHMTVQREPGVRPEDAQDPAGRDRPAASAEAAQILGIEPAARPQAQGALRRPAAARGAGAGHRPQAVGLPLRRAALQPRRQAARADARRDHQAAAPAEDHHHLRHPRPGRGDDHGRPHRGDEGRHPAAGRHAAGALRAARQPLRGRLHRHAADELRPGHAGRRRHPVAAGRLLAAGAGGAARRRGRRGTAPRWSWASGPRTWSPPGREPRGADRRRSGVTVEIVEPLGNEVVVHARVGEDAAHLQARPAPRPGDRQHARAAARARRHSTSSTPRPSAASAPDPATEDLTMRKLTLAPPRRRPGPARRWPRPQGARLVVWHAYRGDEKAAFEKVSPPTTPAPAPRSRSTRWRCPTTPSPTRSPRRCRAARGRTSSSTPRTGWAAGSRPATRSSRSTSTSMTPLKTTGSSRRPWRR